MQIRSFATRAAFSTLILGALVTGCSSERPSPNAEVAALCADPVGRAGERVRVEIDLTDSAVSQSSCTAAACSDGGAPPAACCNHCAVLFVLPCTNGTQIPLRPAASLDLASTDFGPYVPSVSWMGTGLLGEVTLGCLGCEAGVSCSPTMPGTVRAVWGRLVRATALPPDARPDEGWQLEVDEIEYAP